MRALSVDIYKHKGEDFSNHGISSVFNDILVLCDEGNIEVEGTEPNLCKIVEQELWGEIYYHVEPVVKPRGAGWMSGGTVVYSCDSRFGHGPLKLHDRQETWEQYEMLSH